jgi:DNA-binding XRE family transcriptional regulator
MKITARGGVVPPRFTRRIWISPMSHCDDNTLLALDVIGSAVNDRVLVEPKVAVGHNIRTQRERQGLTQEGLANRAGIHLVEVGRAERGVRDMRVSTVAKLAHGLGVPAMELLRGV